MPAALGCPDDPPTEGQPHEISRRTESHSARCDAMHCGCGMVPAMIFDTPNLFRFSMPYITEPAGTPARSTKLRRKRPPPEKHTFR